MKTIVLGLGNPLLGDDGVGWRVAELVQSCLADDTREPHNTQGAEKSKIINHKSKIEVDCSSGGGLALMERMVGYEHAILIDAINLGGRPVGEVNVFPLEQLPNPSLGHLGSAHETNLQNALALGRALGASLPHQVWVVAVESPYVYDFSERLSPSVGQAVPRAARQVLKLLEA